MNTTDTKNIIETLTAQLGAVTLRMLGASGLVMGSDQLPSLTFKIKGSRQASHVSISFDAGLDLYNVRTFTLRGYKLSNDKTTSGVYADQLHTVIESHTGLYTKL